VLRAKPVTVTFEHINIPEAIRAVREQQKTDNLPPGLIIRPMWGEEEEDLQPWQYSIVLTEGSFHITYQGRTLPDIEAVYVTHVPDTGWILFAVDFSAYPDEEGKEYVGEDYDALVELDEAEREAHFMENLSFLVISPAGAIFVTPTGIDAYEGPHQLVRASLIERLYELYRHPDRHPEV
jgi:hypothetical protein